jgi:hypothetical protein
MFVGNGSSAAEHTGTCHAATIAPTCLWNEQYLTQQETERAEYLRKKREQRGEQ